MANRSTVSATQPLLFKFVIIICRARSDEKLSKLNLDSFRFIRTDFSHSSDVFWSSCLLRNNHPYSSLRLMNLLYKIHGISSSHVASRAFLQFASSSFDWFRWKWEGVRWARLFGVIGRVRESLSTGIPLYLKYTKSFVERNEILIGNSKRLLKIHSISAGGLCNLDQKILLKFAEILRLRMDEHLSCIPCASLVTSRSHTLTTNVLSYTTTIWKFFFHNF